MSNKSTATTNKPEANNVPDVDGVETELTDEMEVTAAPYAPMSRIVRFYENTKSKTNAKAPTHFAELDSLDFPGMVHACNVFARRSDTGEIVDYDVTLPGVNRFDAGAFRARPLFVESRGVQYPVAGSFDPNGANIAQNWSANLKLAFLQFKSTKNPVQSVIL